MSREQTDFASCYNKADACIWITSIWCKRIQNLSKKPKNASLPLCCSLKFTTGFDRFIAWYTNKLLRRFWWIPVLYLREVTTFCFESRFVSHNRESTQFLGRGSVNTEANYRLHLKKGVKNECVVTGWTWLSAHNVSVIKTNTVEGGNVFPKAH